MYTIRSMSTTDYAPQYGQYNVTKYHIYLLAEGHRNGAYWSQSGPHVRFATAKEAAAYAKRVLKNNCWQVVPVDDRHLPCYWEIQEMNMPHWQTYLGPDHNGKYCTWTEAMRRSERAMDFHRRANEMKLAG